MVELSHIAVTYGTKQNPTPALKDVTVSFREDEIVSVMGKSGSGKTTLLKVIGGLLVPTAGTCLIGGDDLYKLSADQRCVFRRDKIGFIFQSCDLVPELTVYENIVLPLLLAKRDFTEETVLSLCRELGIEDLVDRLPNEISGGEGQRTAIARAVICEPEVLLCDEPTGNLDRQNTEAILALLTKIRSLTHAAIVVVTHDPEVAAIADRRLIMADGRIEERP